MPVNNRGTKSYILYSFHVQTSPLLKNSPTCSGGACWRSNFCVKMQQEVSFCYVTYSRIFWIWFSSICSMHDSLLSQRQSLRRSTTFFLFAYDFSAFSEKFAQSNGFRSVLDLAGSLVLIKSHTSSYRFPWKVHSHSHTKCKRSSHFLSRLCNLAVLT